MPRFFGVALVLDGVDGASSEVKLAQPVHSTLRAWSLSTLTLALSSRRRQTSELLLDDAPGVGGGLGGVELCGDAELLDVDLGRRLEAVPGGLEDALFLVGEEGFVGLDGRGLFGRRSGHGDDFGVELGGEVSLGHWVLREMGG